MLAAFGIQTWVSMDTLSRPTPAELVPKAVKTMVTDKTNTGMTLTVNGSGI